jgi:predicted Zn finger-like uncharacterized protein
MFKVVPDQLRISEGWVRCGQCDEVFDASAHLVDGQHTEVELAVADQSAPLPSQTTVVAPEAAEQPDAPLPVEAPGLDKAVMTPGWAVAHAEAIEPVLEEFQLSDEVEHPPRGLDDDDTRLVHEAHMTAGPAELSFMRHKKSGTFWRRSRVRAGLMLAGLLLFLGLALQVIVHERDRIAAVEPGLKTLVEAVCVPMQCTVSAVRQIDSGVIESSSFNKIRGDVYRLNFTLRNTAPIELAAPAIELSLTDLQDQPIMRRVFRPAEVGLRSDVISSSAEVSGSLTLSIKTNGGADRITGYRVLAFYP